ncbi:MAG TPA: MarR family transcriptional regulator [Streptosporangiaceae bacterium]
MERDRKPIRQPAGSADAHRDAHWDIAQPGTQYAEDAESRRALVGLTARFAARFAHWLEGRACDGLSYTRLRLLQTLHCSGPAIMRDLGAQLGATPRNMTAIVDALEDARLVVRRPHPTDRRATLVELSPAGIAEAEQELEPRLDAMAELFTRLSVEEREQFTAVMTKLMHAMGGGGTECAEEQFGAGALPPEIHPRSSF